MVSPTEAAQGSLTNKDPDSGSEQTPYTNYRDGPGKVHWELTPCLEHGIERLKPSCKAGPEVSRCSYATDNYLKA